MPSSRSGHKPQQQTQTKTAKLKVLFSQGWDTRDAAEIAQATVRYARKVRESMRAISAGMTLNKKYSRLSQDVSDLRRLLLSHIEQSREQSREQAKSKASKLRRVV